MTKVQLMAAVQLLEAEVEALDKKDDTNIVRLNNIESSKGNEFAILIEKHDRLLRRKWGESFKPMKGSVIGSEIDYEAYYKKAKAENKKLMSSLKALVQKVFKDKK